MVAQNKFTLDDIDPLKNYVLDDGVVVQGSTIIGSSEGDPNLNSSLVPFVKSQYMPKNASEINASNKSGVTIAQNGVSNSGEDNFKGLGALDGTLGQYIPQAQNIYNSLYSKSKKQQEKEDRMNTGMMMLNFFTKMGAESSRPGATALGAASVAGADTASMYIKKVNADRARRDAEKKGVVGLASQLMTSADTKALALAKAKNVKPGKPDPYKITNQSEVLKTLRELNVSLINPDTKKFWDNGDIIPLTTAQYDKFGLGTLSIFKEVSPPKPNPFERLRDGIIKDFQIFNKGTLPVGGTSKLLASIIELKDQKLRPIPDPRDPTKIVMTLQQGVDMYDVLEKEFGKEAVDKLRTKAGIDITDKFITPSGTSGEATKDGDKYEVLDIGGTKFTILSSQEGKLGTTEVKSLTNAKSGLKDLKTALSLMFPNGKYNRALVTTMNLTPDWGLGLLDIMSPKGIGGDAKTTIEAMKRAIEIILRERSGAAVPPAELVNYLKLYLPNSLNNEVQARNKIDALLQYFKGSIDGINKGRQKNGSNADENFFNQKLPDKIIDKTMKDGGKIMGRKVMIQEGMSYIETTPGSGNFQPLVTKSK